MTVLKPTLHALRSQGRGLWYGAALAATLLAGCAVEWENPKAARQVAQEQQPPGSVYMGWRVFQDRCARCHGADASGTTSAPNLLPRVRDLSSRQFVSLVLLRYDATLQGAPTPKASAPSEAQVEVIMQRKDQPLSMPAWQDEPRVNAHILDLYAYLSARADGRQGPERPAP